MVHGTNTASTKDAYSRLELVKGHIRKDSSSTNTQDNVILMIGEKDVEQNMKWSHHVFLRFYKVHPAVHVLINIP